MREPETPAIGGAPSSRVARLFDRVARLYDLSFLQTRVYRPGQDLALSQLSSLNPKRVLDVGCGTGIFASRLRAELDADLVCGCDLSAGMLEQAAARSRGVRWIQADAASVPLRGETIDAVVCTEAFHFFDQPAALAEFYRVLRSGGLLLVALINPRTEAASRLLRAQGRMLGAGTWPTRAQMRRMVEGAGFVVKGQHRVSRILGRLVPTVLTVAHRSGS